MPIEAQYLPYQNTLRQKNGVLDELNVLFFIKRHVNKARQ